MNKLLVSDNINLNNGIYNLDFNSKESILNINGDTYIYIVDSQIKKLTVNLDDDSNLNFYKFDNSLNNDVEIIINVKNNSKVNFNINFQNKKIVNLNVSSHIIGNNNKVNINLRNISNDNYSNIKVDMNILKDTFNNIALEDLKGINNGGFISIEPNILCSSNEVEANHLTTIGTVDSDSINYLMSKGISLEKAKEILLKGFIKSNLDNNLKELLGGE